MASASSRALQRLAEQATHYRHTAALQQGHAGVNGNAQILTALPHHQLPVLHLPQEYIQRFFQAFFGLGLYPCEFGDRVARANLVAIIVNLPLNAVERVHHLRAPRPGIHHHQLGLVVVAFAQIAARILLPHLDLLHHIGEICLGLASVAMLVLEEVRQVRDALRRQRIDVPIQCEGPDIDDAEIFGAIKIGAEAVQAYRRYSPGGRRCGIAEA